MTNKTTQALQTSRWPLYVCLRKRATRGGDAVAMTSYTYVGAVRTVTILLGSSTEAMNFEHVIRDAAVAVRIHLVEHDEEQIET